jgi:hypothetical protein
MRHVPRALSVRLNRLLSTRSFSSEQARRITPARSGAMFEPFVVEIWGELAGVVLRKGNAFRFHAIARPFLELDGTQFTTPGHARLAAARLLRPPQVSR